MVGLCHDVEKEMLARALTEFFTTAGYHYK